MIVKIAKYLKFNIFKLDFIYKSIFIINNQTILNMFYYLIL